MTTRKRWTTEKFTNYVLDTFGREFEVRGEYVNNNTEILMYHTKCEREFEVRPGNFKTRKRCPLCFGKFKKTTDQFKKEVVELVGDEFEVLNEYNGAKVNVSVRHNKCGFEFNVTPTDFLSGGNRCPDCAKNKKKNTEIFKQEVYKLVGSEYDVLGEYKGKRAPITIKHSACGTTFEKMPELFLIGNKCPKCSLERRSGEYHYRYNPKLTEEERLRRDMFNGELKKWRKLVFTRDNFTCKICNVKGGN